MEQKKKHGCATCTSASIDGNWCYAYCNRIYPEMKDDSPCRSWHPYGTKRTPTSSAPATSFPSQE